MSSAQHPSSNGAAAAAGDGGDHNHQHHQQADRPTKQARVNEKDGGSEKKVPSFIVADNFIGGEFVSAVSNQYLDIHSPADLSLIGLSFNGFL